MLVGFIREYVVGVIEFIWFSVKYSKVCDGCKLQAGLYNGSSIRPNEV